MSSGGTAINAGFFRNVGRTRRQGGELGFEAAVARWTLALRYSYVVATFQSPFALSSPNNSSADAAGDILVSPGDRIPGLPRHAFKVRAQYAFDSRVTAGVTVAAFSNQRARGDENNLDRNGAVPGYALVNLDAQFEFASGWQLFASATNVGGYDYQRAIKRVPFAKVTPERAAAYILDGVAKNRSMVTFPAYNRVLVGLYRLLPDLMSKVVNRA